MGGRSTVVVAAMGWLAAGAIAAGASDGAEEGFVVPDSTFFGEQWSLFNFGQGFGGGPPGTVDVDIRAPEAWAITQGDPSIVVAVLDTGVDRHHPDLAPNMWTNAAESVSGNDEDGNGFVDDTWGWDFVDGNSDPSDVRVADANTGRNAMAHGTAVASVIAAADNGEGMVGIAPAARIMALRVIGEGIHDQDIADAIDYAAANGARIVNLSLATFVPGFGFPLTADAIARHPDLLFVAGAGNSANDADIVRPEPCTVDVDHLICVAAYDEHGELAVFESGGSNRGATTVHLAAPGRGVLAARAPFETVWEDDLDGDVGQRWALDIGAGAWRSTVTPNGSGLGVPKDTNGATSLRLVQPVDLSERDSCRFHVEVESTERGGLVTLEESLDGEFWVQRVGARGLSLMGGTDGIEEYTVALDGDLEQVWFGLQHTPSGGQAGDITLERLAVSCRSGAYDGRNFGYAEGTSFATPLTAGVAALVLSKYPQLTPVEVLEVILEGARPLPGWDELTVTGRGLDAHGALLAAAELTGSEEDATNANQGGDPSSPGAGQGGWMDGLRLPNAGELITPPPARSEDGIIAGGAAPITEDHPGSHPDQPDAQSVAKPQGWDFPWIELGGGLILVTVGGAYFVFRRRRDGRLERVSVAAGEPSPDSGQQRETHIDPETGVAILEAVIEFVDRDAARAAKKVTGPMGFINELFTRYGENLETLRDGQQQRQQKRLEKRYEAARQELNDEQYEAFAKGPRYSDGLADVVHVPLAFGRAFVDTVQSRLLH